jgi:HD-GYP domain-containing protein (c-di-GMP phosphodiesterase class II)
VTTDELNRTDITGIRATLKEEEKDVQLSREKGLDLVNELFMSTRTFTLHASDNKATEYPIQRLVATIRSLIESLGTAQFIVAEGEAYINDVRIRVEARNYGNLQHITQLMDSHDLGGITFSRSLSPEKARGLIEALNTRPPKDRPLDALRENCVDREVPVGLEPPFVQATDDMTLQAVPNENEGTAGYAQGIAALKDYADVVVSEGFANPLKVRRAVQDMIDLSAEDIELPLKLQAIHGVEDPFFNHSVNVANLSIAVGKRLGLSKVYLRELGVAAVFHDVGYAFLDAPEEGDDDYARKREENRQLHPITGVMLVSNEKGYQPHKARRMRVALEHHLHFKRPGGFPPLFTNRLGVFTRIVQVADHYDAMVAPDATTKNSPFLPAKAMRKIMQGAGVRFDPVVVKAFVQVMGRHPYGSLVKLNTREMAIVMGAGRPGEGFKRPPIRIVRAADGAKMNNAVDLLDEEHHDRWIIRALDPVAKGIDINSYLFGEYAEISEIMEGVDPPAPRGSTAEESSPEASQETTPEPSQGFMPPRVSKPPPKEVFRSPPRAKAPREPQAEPAPEPEEEPVQWVVDSVEEDEDEVTLDIEY